MKRQTEKMDSAGLAVLMQQNGQIAADLAGIRADVNRALTRLEVVDNERKTDAGALADHESRIRGLERLKYMIFAASLAGGSGGVWALFTNLHH